MNAITRQPLLRSAGLGGVSKEFAERFSGWERGKRIKCREWSVTTPKRGRNQPKDELARVLWRKLQEGRIPNPATRAAIEREHAAAFTRFAAEAASAEGGR